MAGSPKELMKTLVKARVTQVREACENVRNTARTVDAFAEENSDGY